MVGRPPAKPGELTGQQQLILNFIRDELEAGRPFPGPTAIARHMGWKHASSAGNAMRKLRQRGALKHDGFNNWEVKR
jgi:hypothetical protein